MCDFFVGTIYSDVLGSPDSWIDAKTRRAMLDKAPKFEAYGKRFVTENQAWINKRVKRDS